MVDLEPVVDPKDVETLRSLVERHAAYTGSMPARSILDNWEESLPRFVKVMPKDYKRALAQLEAEQQAAQPGAVPA